MNEPSDRYRPVSGEQGMALISALLLLLVVSLLAVGLSMDTSMDVRLSAYQKFRAQALGYAESGLTAGSDILESNAADTGWTGHSSLPFPFPNLSTDYNGSVDIYANGLTNGTFYLDPNPNENKTIGFTGDIHADVITQRVGSQITHGSAMQVAAGYAGIGKSLGGGGTFVVYNVQSTGFGYDNCQACVAGNYRMVTK